MKRVALSARGVETRAHGAQGARGLKRDFRAKTPFYWVKMDFEKNRRFWRKIGRKFTKKDHPKRQNLEILYKFGLKSLKLIVYWVKNDWVKI